MSTSTFKNNQSSEETVKHLLVDGRDPTISKDLLTTQMGIADLPSFEHVTEFDEWLNIVRSSVDPSDTKIEKKFKCFGYDCALLLPVVPFIEYNKPCQENAWEMLGKRVYPTIQVASLSHGVEASNVAHVIANHLLETKMYKGCIVDNSRSGVTPMMTSKGVVHGNYTANPKWTDGFLP